MNAITTKTTLGRNIPQPTYQAARTASPAVAYHFKQHFEAARQNGVLQLAPEPDASVIEAIIDVGFWASLGREEGHSPKISLAFLPPEMAGTPMVFKHHLPFQTNTLTKLAPAVERPGIHLGVWQEDGELFLWGTTRDIPGLCFVLEVVEPGLLVVKHRRIDGMGKFVNVATLKGDQIKVVDEQSRNAADRPPIISSLLGFTSPYSEADSVNILVQLAASMRAHGRGGSLLVVPADTEEWKDSIIQPITYPVLSAFSGLSDLMQLNDQEENRMLWHSLLRQAVDSVGGLTAVDGATIINERHELLAFGAKIGRSWKSTRVDQIVITEPIIGSAANVIHPAKLGGTRHLSAAQFVFDQRDAVALVASQDGRFTIFAWSPREEMVHAHQIDILLL
ncbi:MAG: putative sensor domain DACNV-containing protein [Janthinobacterium lividum]